MSDLQGKDIIELIDEKYVKEQELNKREELIKLENKKEDVLVVEV